jgi:hypothetical protein
LCTSTGTATSHFGVAPGTDGGRTSPETRRPRHNGRYDSQAGDDVPRKGRARRFREARQLKQGFDDGLFKEGSGTLADLSDKADSDEDSEDDFDDELEDEEEDWDPDHNVNR